MTLPGNSWARVDLVRAPSRCGQCRRQRGVIRRMRAGEARAASTLWQDGSRSDPASGSLCYEDPRRRYGKREHSAAGRHRHS